MSKQVKVEVEMPLITNLSKGTKSPVDGKHLNLFNALVDLGYLSWVEEEKSLEEEFTDDFNKQTSFITPEQRAIKACVTATDHFKKKFDEAVAKIQPFLASRQTAHIIRTAMFGEEE